jgi:hypothetical protein
MVDDAICIFSLFCILLLATAASVPEHSSESISPIAVSREVGWEQLGDLPKLEKQEIDSRATRILLDELCGPVACYFAATMLLDKRPAFFEVVKECSLETRDRPCSMLDLKRCCESLGFEPRAVYVESRELTPRMLPAILHLDAPEAHFQLAMYMGHDKRVACVRDGRVFPLNENEIHRRWSGYILMLDPPPSTNQVLTPILLGFGLPLMAGLLLRKKLSGRTREASGGNQ